MFAYLLSVSLVLLWLVIGLGIATALRPRKPFQNLLLAPAIGAAFTLLSVFTLNRAGLPTRSFALPLTMALATSAVVMVWRFRPVIPWRRYVPFLGLVVLAMALTGRPMFEFGFDWVSYCNDDMANYVLGAHRFADRGFFEPIDAGTFAAFRDIPALFWFFHVIMDIRPGSELLLAWLIGLAGLNGFQLFMPLILALHGALITSAAALVYRNASRRRAALITALLLTFSAMAALGTVYQLIAQVFGLLLVSASGALLTTRLDLVSPRNLLGAGALAAIPVAACFVVYPELLPFLGLPCAIYLGVSALRNRTAIRPLFRFAAASLAALFLLLNTMIPTALNFLMRQGGGSLKFIGVEDALFPYYLIPVGFANFFGILPTAYYPSENILSAAIALGIFMATLSVLLLVPLLRRIEPAAVFTAVFLAISALFFLRRHDFPLYKLAMYVQPFLLGCFGIAAAAVWRGKGFYGAGSTAARGAVVGMGLLMLAVNLFSHTYFVQISRGVNEGIGGGSFVEIPNASLSGITRELQRSGQTVTVPVVLTDSFNMVLTKFSSLFFRGKSFIPITQRIEANFIPPPGMIPLMEGAKLMGHHPPDAIRQASQLMASYEHSLHYFFFDFHTPGQRSRLLRTGVQMGPDSALGESIVLADSASQTIINRRHTGSLGRGNVIPVAHRNLQNHLIFVPSDLGTNYYTRDSTYISLFQLESDYMVPDTSMSGVGRRGVFRVLNPTPGFRMMLDFTATLKSDGENKLPPATAVGTTRVAFPFVGRGSARVFSGPIEPQTAGGQRLVGFDMGVDGTRFPSPRPGLMGLYGTDVPIDRRRLVGFARNISLVSEEQYQRLAPPVSISRFPTDLLHPDLEYSGLYEDGWIAESSFLRLRSGEADHVAVRGSIPKLGTREFHTEARLLLNGREVARQTLRPGSFELRARCIPQSGRNQVELQFSDTQSLPAPDNRKVSARLDFIGFESAQAAVSSAPPAQSIPDIIPSGSPISLGENWYPIENFHGERFRWVANDAAFAVSGGGSLKAELEAGPGIGSHAFVLKVLDSSGATVLSVPVKGRQTIQLDLPSQPGKPSQFRLHVDGGGKRIAQDPRILNFRVFRLEPPAAPTVPRNIACCGIALGEGWHTVETFGGQTFRWVANNAQLKIPPSSPRRLSLEVEPGPGVASKPFTLKISDSSGRQLYAVSVAGRRKIPVDLPPASYRLHLDGGGKPTPNDPRILNFRVFSIAAQ